jgi:hypothetical protein
MHKRWSNKLAMASLALYTLSIPSLVFADETVLEPPPSEAKEEKQAGLKLHEMVTLTGLFEVDAGFTKDFEKKSTSNLELATAELGLDVTLKPWATGHIVLAYNGDDEDVEVDEANITLGKTGEMPIFLTAGKVYLPFGDFTTAMLQDPLTLTLGEIRDAGLIGGIEMHGFAAMVFTYSGMEETGKDENINGFGAAVTYGYEQDDIRLSTGISLVSNLADASGINDSLDEAGVTTIAEVVPGLAAHLNMGFGPFAITGEYVGALDGFATEELAFGDSGARPYAWRGEFSYTAEFLTKEMVAAVAYQQSGEALALELPAQRLSAAATVTVIDGTTIGIEGFFDQDYQESDGGTGEEGYGCIARLAYAF